MTTLPPRLSAEIKTIKAMMVHLQSTYHPRSDQWEALEHESWILDQGIQAIRDNAPSKRRNSVLLNTRLEGEFPELCGRLSEVFSSIDRHLEGA